MMALHHDVGADLFFESPRWARGAHAQTMGGYLLRSDRGVTRRRERFELPDGDFVDLDWFCAAESAAGSVPERPLVLALHGMEGSTRSRYMAVLARELAALAIDCVGLNFRGCSGEPNRLPRAYHAGEFGDAVFVLEQLRARFPRRRLGAVGFSLGGNVLLRWLGEAGASSARLVSGAAAVSVPFDLAVGARYTAIGPGRIYSRRLVRDLRRKVARKRALVSARIEVAAALRAATFEQFDDAFTAPLHGFRDADDYYAQSSSAPWLPGIAVPTCVVHALDDPFLPATAVPLAALRGNPSITALLSAAGGHVGFVHGTPWAPRFFAEQAIARFLARTLEAAG